MWLKTERETVNAFSPYFFSFSSGKTDLVQKATFKAIGHVLSQKSPNFYKVPVRKLGIPPLVGPKCTKTSRTSSKLAPFKGGKGNPNFRMKDSVEFW